jgi:hypothetical protein
MFLTSMKVVLLVFVGTFGAWALADTLNFQATLGDGEIRVTRDKPPVSDAALPTVARKLIHINGVECKQNPRRRLGLLITT